MKAKEIMQSLIGSEFNKEFNVKIVDEKGVRSHYNRLLKCIFIDLDNDKNNKKGSYTALYHEIGHHIDNLNKLSNKQLFGRLILRDCEDLIPIIYTLKRDIAENPYMHGLSDIISGATHNIYKLKYTHKNEYWDLGSHKLSSEVFAHFYEAYIRNDMNKINLYETYLPRAFSLFINMVKYL